MEAWASASAAPASARGKGKGKATGKDKDKGKARYRAPRTETFLQTEALFEDCWLNAYDKGKGKGKDEAWEQEYVELMQNIGDIYAHAQDPRRAA